MSSVLASQDVREPEFAHTQIQDVWRHNFDDAIAAIASIIETGEYTIVSFDTEFPGIIHEGVEWDQGLLKYKPRYEWVKKNVDSLRLIQFGITLGDEKGRVPSPISTWQFNMQFDVNNDKHNSDSIKLLTEAGLNFQKHKQEGIPQLKLAKCLRSCGLVQN